MFLQREVTVITFIEKITPVKEMQMCCGYILVGVIHRISKSARWRTEVTDIKLRRWLLLPVSPKFFAASEAGVELESLC